MSKKRSSVEGGNGASLVAVPPPMTTEEFANMVGEFRKRGLPVILYVFNGPESINANRLLQDVHFRQMAAVSHELSEWARVGENQHIAQVSQGGGGLAKPGLILPKDLRGQGQG